MSVVWPAFIVKQGKKRETPANVEIIRNADGLETSNAVNSVFKLPNTSPTPRVRRCPLCAGWSRNCASRSFNASSLRRLVGITSAISRPFKIQDRGLLKLNPNWQQTLRGERELSKAPCFSSTASQALLSQTTTFNLTTQTFTAISKTDNDGLAARLQGTVSKHWRFDGIVAHPRTSTFGTPPIKGDQAFLNLFANGLETSFEPKFIYRNANEKSSKVIGAFMYDRRRGGCELQRGCDGLQRLHRVN